MISVSEAKLVYSALVKGAMQGGYGTDVAAFLAGGKRLDHADMQQIIGLAHMLEEPSGMRPRVYQIGEDEGSLLLLVGNEVKNGEYYVDVASDWSTISARPGKLTKAWPVQTAHFVGFTVYSGNYNVSLERFKKMSPEERKRGWDGFCPAGYHGLDYQGQACDLCAKDSTGKRELPF